MPRKMNKIRYFIVLPLLLMILTACGNNSDQQTEEPIKKQVNIQLITKQEQVVTSLAVSGTVVPKQYSMIRSLTPGTVEYLVPVGSPVSIGQPLFSIRDQGVESNYFNAQQSFEQTQITTQQRVQQAELALNSAKARLDLARAQYSNTVSQTEQNTRTAENSAIVAYNSAYNSIFQLVFNYNTGKNLDDPQYIFYDLVSTDPQLRSDTAFLFKRVVEDFKILSENISYDNLSGALDKIYEALTLAKSLADNSAILLQKAIATENIDAATLQANKTTNAGYQTSINTHVSTILSIESTLENTSINNRLVIDNAQAQLDLAEIEYNNADIGLQNAKDSAELQNSSSRAQFDNAAYNYNNLTLAAPFSGTILSHYVKAGEQVSVGREIIELGNLSIIEITVDVDVNLAKAIRLNDKVLIDDQYEGLVSEIEPIGDLTSGKVSVKVQSQEAKDLAAGNSAEIKFNLTYNDINKIVVPIKSVTVEASGNYVYVVAEGDKVERKDVVLGQVYGNQVSVESGLEEGDSLILLNGVFVSAGDEVEITE